MQSMLLNTKNAASLRGVSVKTPIEFHIEGFEKHLAAKDNTPLHVRQTVRRLERYVSETKR